jgi:hypothetical protein
MMAIFPSKLRRKCVIQLPDCYRQKFQYYSKIRTISKHKTTQFKLLRFLYCLNDMRNLLIVILREEEPLAELWTMERYILEVNVRALKLTANQ